MSANFWFAVAKVVKNLQVCKKNRILVRFFYSERGFLAGGTAKCTPKRHERFVDPAEQDSQEEGERQYRMYRSDWKGTEGNSRG